MIIPSPVRRAARFALGESGYDALRRRYPHYLQRQAAEKLIEALQE